MRVNITIEGSPSRSMVGSILIAVGGFAIAVGSLLSWIKVDLLGLSFRGWDVLDGKVLALLGALVFMWGLWGIALAAKGESKSLVMGLVSFQGALALGVTLGLVLALYVSGSLNAVDLPFGGKASLASIGIGLWIALAGSVLTLAGGVIAWERALSEAGKREPVIVIGLVAVFVVAGLVTVFYASGRSLQEQFPSRESAGAPPSESTATQSSANLTGSSFQSPTGNIQCGFSLEERGDVYCEVRNLDQLGWIHGGQPRRVSIGAIADGGRRLSAGPILAYGQGIENAGIYCASEQDAMRCTDLTSGVGMSMNRDGITRIG